MTHYRLDENNNAVPCSRDEWIAMSRDVESRRIGLSVGSGYSVSTVLVGLENHMFETLIQKSGGTAGICAYRTREEAMQGHNDYVLMAECGFFPCDGWIRNTGEPPETDNVDVLYQNGQAEHVNRNAEELCWDRFDGRFSVFAYKEFNPKPHEQ